MILNSPLRFRDQAGPLFGFQAGSFLRGSPFGIPVHRGGFRYRLRQGRWLLSTPPKSQGHNQDRHNCIPLLHCSPSFGECCPGTEAQYRRIEGCLPRQRGNVSASNLQVLNAILYVTEHGCKWRGLPTRFGNWHTIYTRMNRWAKAGVLDRVFTVLQEQQIIRIKIEAMSVDSTIVKVHPDGTGATKKGPQAIGKSRGGWTTKIHMVAADA